VNTDDSQERVTLTEILDLLPRLAARVGEDDDGIAMDVDAAVFASDGVFTLGDTTIASPDTWIIELDWVAPGSSRSDLYGDFYRLLGAIAEKTMVVHRTKSADREIFDVLLGSVGPTGDHAHHLRFLIRRHAASKGSPSPGSLQEPNR
jgi:hypothetical protein